jgi:phosphoglycolate phosphatase
LIGCVVYDCDGVLFDSLDTNRRLYNDICIAMGRADVKVSELEYCHTHTVYQCINHLFPDDAEQETRAAELLRSSINFKDYVPYLKMEPHLLETLSALREQGIKTAINTNRTSSMPYVMSTFNLGPYFDMVVTALDVKQPKPHPESMEKILNELTISKEETLYIGDSDVDLALAQASDVTFVSYRCPEISQGLLIEDHREIIEIVKMMNGRNSNA